MSLEVDPPREQRPALLNLALPLAEPGTRRRVLVVDDEPGMRYVARRVLEKRFDVVEAEDGRHALEILEREPLHIAIVDVRLPDVSGLDLLTSLKLSSPSIDVIVMTGSAADMDETLEAAIRRKAFFFLRKPFPMTVLETLTERVAETQELEERLVAYARTLEGYLESARAFQQRLLPPRFWKGSGIRIASHYSPSEKLSGDSFDYWNLAGGGTAVAIVDVMGHGPSSAMITGIVKSQLRSLTPEFDTPGEVLSCLEEELERIALTSFLTAFLIFDRPEEGKLTYAGAGHPPALLWTPEEHDGSASSIRPLLSEGLPLNTRLQTGARTTTELSRRPGSRFLLVTDGYTEATSAEGAVFNETDGGPNTPLWNPATPFGQAVERALGAESPETGIVTLERAWREFTTGTQGEDDRASLLAWLL